ncbi:MAG: response regulator [Maritimibacter harenae]|jgi:two-component system chemotaxis response regulator CheY|uniref:Response regulator n=1 Tax=Maritimibacter harenae TaxID=2606218 RepID=A0A845M7A6_9RHOB|nr:response regulator [Maritimibacter harenae]MZR15182.1 response regulator [Maritimibacter harenae]
MSRTILVVDDSPSVRHMIASTLQSAGYDVETAQDGQEALEFTERRPFQAVITDQNMPRLDGLGFCQAFRAKPQNQGVPVIFLSTESEGSIKDRARAAGAIGWMTKPFDQEKLLSVVGKVVGP